MASYNARNRDPLLDSTTQAAIERRSKELIGIALILLGLASAAMIWSYTPDDPNWMVSTDAPVQNWMGRIGASIAAPLFMIVGWGSWSIALVLIGWGIRFAGRSLRMTSWDAASSTTCIGTIRATWRVACDPVA